MGNNTPHTDNNGIIERLLHSVKTIVTTFTKVAKKSLIYVMLASMLATGCTPIEDIIDDIPGIDVQGDKDKGDKDKVEKKYKDRSDLFNYVMTHGEYINEYNDLKSGSVDFKSYKYDCIPFTFLESQGMDIQPILNNKQFARCYGMIKENEPNNLYMLVEVRFKDAIIPYYDMYLLRYELTDQEMDEYRYYFPSSGSTFQGCFIHDAISATKKEKIITHTKISVSAYDEMTQNICNSTSKKYNRSTSQIMLKSYDEENDTFEVYAFSPTNKSGEILTLPLQCYPTAGGLFITDDGIFNGTVKGGKFNNMFGYLYADNADNITRESIAGYSNYHKDIPFREITEQMNILIQ